MHPNQVPPGREPRCLDMETPPDDERFNRLEERIAWLERHITEQDRAMLELTELTEKLRHELLRLQNRASDGPGTTPVGFESAEERPPHY
jgi:SlyX protein